MKDTRCVFHEKKLQVIVGIGIDTVDVVSFRNRLDDRLIDQLFLPAEIEYCRTQARPWENFAARFAAKEAAFKAMGRGLSSGIRFLDVEVTRNTETVSESGIHVNDVIDIIYRLRNGQSQRLINRETGIGRKTIRKYFLVSEKNGWLSLEVPLPELDIVSKKLAERKSAQIDKNQKSSLEPYRAVITDWLKEKYNRKRILHLLRSIWMWL